MFLRIVLIGIASFSLSSCGNWNSVYRSFDITDGSGAMVDIKQRAVIVNKKNTIDDKTGKVLSTEFLVCAEPSPDALSAYAAEIAGKVNVPQEVGIELATTFNEGTSFVGLRTQSIQLLRDSMYRLCEGHLNGAIDKAQYEILARRYQKYMVALLSIEQLTGTIRSPTIVINSQGRSEASRSLSDMRDELSKIDEELVPHLKTKDELTQKIEGLEKQKIEENNKLEADRNKDKVKNIEEGIEANKKKVEEIQSKIDPLSKDKEAISNGIESARGVAAEGSTIAVISNIGIPTSRSSEDILAVAKSVENIVLNIINTDDFGQICLSYIGDPETDKTSDIYKRCNDYLKNINNASKFEAEKGYALLDRLKKIENGDSEIILDQLLETSKRLKDFSTVKSTSPKLILD